MNPVNTNNFTLPIQQRSATHAIFNLIGVADLVASRKGFITQKRHFTQGEGKSLFCRAIAIEGKTSGENLLSDSEIIDISQISNRINLATAKRN